MASNIEKIKSSKTVREDIYRKDRGTKHDRRAKRACKRDEGNKVESILDPKYGESSC